MISGFSRGLGLMSWVHAPKASPWTPEELFASGENGCNFTDLASCEMYQDASKTTVADTDGDPVKVLVDPLNGHEFACSVDANRPTLNISGGLRWLSFGGNDFLRCSSRMGMPADPDLTVACAFRLESPVGSCTVFVVGDDNLAAGNCMARVYSDWSWRYGNGYNIFSPPNPAADTDYVARFARETGDRPIAGEHIAVNGVDLSSSSSLSNGLVANWASIIGYSGSGSFFYGRLYGLLAIERRLTADEASNLDNYLAAKAGISL